MDMEYTAEETPKPEENDAGFKPEVPPIVRNYVYFSGLIWGAIATLLTAIAAVWWPDHATEILATVGGVSSAVAFLAGGLGVMYRPHHR